MTSKGRFSGLLAGFAMMIMTVAIGEAIGKIPVAALVGVMLAVSYHTFEKSTCRVLYEAFTQKKWEGSGCCGKKAKKGDKAGSRI